MKSSIWHLPCCAVPSVRSLLPEEGEEEPQEAEGEPQRRPGEMTPEEAERLLDAIEEDPEDVNRKPAATRGRKPRKPWL